MSHEDQVQILLHKLRLGFAMDLDEHADWLETQLNEIHISGSQDLLGEVKRRVHSLKGSGGTYGLHLLSLVCHQFEDQLEREGAGISAPQLQILIAHIDLLRDIAQRAIKEDEPVFDDLELRMHQLIKPVSRGACLVIEPTQLMQQLLYKLLIEKGYRVSLVDSGLTALQLLVKQPFDLIITARDTGDLDSQALAAAIKVSPGLNHTTPVILISSRVDHLHEPRHFDLVLQRNSLIAEKLDAYLTAIQKVEKRDD